MNGGPRASITRSGQVLVVIAPHHPALAERAHALHGRWNGHAWVFRASQLEGVRGLCAELFGEVELIEAPPTVWPPGALGGTDEITNPGLAGDAEDITAVTAVGPAAPGSGSDSSDRGEESNPVRRVVREVDPYAGERAALEAEIQRLLKRIRELKARLNELDRLSR